TIERGQHFITMAGGEVFKLAVKSMADAAEEAIAEAGLTLDDIDILIPHQANVRIIDGVAKRLRFPPEKVFVNTQRYGHTSAVARSPTGPLPTTWNQPLLTRPVSGSRATRSPVPPATRRPCPRPHPAPYLFCFEVLTVAFRGVTCPSRGE